ncbi:hypothetical protein D3C77_573560 [compost metagenome]
MLLSKYFKLSIVQIFTSPRDEITQWDVKAPQFLLSERLLSIIDIKLLYLLLMIFSFSSSKTISSEVKYKSLSAPMALPKERTGEMPKCSMFKLCTQSAISSISFMFLLVMTVAVLIFTLFSASFIILRLIRSKVLGALVNQCK